MYFFFVDQEPFIACVKEQQALWYPILSELCAGKQLSEELRDPSILQLAIQNVHIIDAYIAWYVFQQVWCKI